MSLCLFLGERRLRQINTRDRLFGTEVSKPSPKKVNPTFKSTIFDSEAPSSPQRTPKKTIPALGKPL
ncbi:hypothetical protein OESDEN_09729 [Oesophagostomum dentatum]|uniref:Uncharacterized protein n=1 Tax=Oesophagostomum dentatum TaxID=61180 RepID=A0A0B1SZK7_OESDE|nr:hypothetical protein OESDEN_09729 [Oesophagostomum dentatum]